MNNEITPTGGENPGPGDGQAAKPESLKTVAMTVYGLQAAAFFVGITAIVAVIIAHVKIGDSRGSWLESHFRWQIRTFWFSILWCVVGLILTLVVVGYAVLVGVLVWTIYRIAKGWLRLLDGKAMYTST